MAKIENIKGREIIDSRGFPTVEAEVHLDDKTFGIASVPSGASTGKFEAHELRDGDNKRFLGKGVLKAVENINTIISDHLKGHYSDEQKEIDDLMIKLDGTKNKERLGANAILAVSIANYKLASKRNDFSGCVTPVPLVNILNGGVHADNTLDIQEFMIVPTNADTFKHAVQISCEIFHTLKKILSDNSLSTNLGDEGGYAPQLKNHDEALNYLMKSIEKE
ncbi:MAG: phosphopyruvate hydratase, partial [Pelagibacteraceae bacterium]|nr:phosphopyruvate hydratase [Pelagibacteraceae bacterium]